MKEKMPCFFLGFLFLSVSIAPAQGIRKPVWAGQFYEADGQALSSQIDGLLAAAKSEAVPAGKIQVLIVPHAGYAYSGKTAAAAYRLVQGKDIETVVILGPTHRIRFEGCSIYLQGGFETPLGVAEIDEPAARAIAKASGFGFIAEAHAEEHSIEVQVPFLQKVLPRAKIVPVVIGDPAERTIRTLAAALSKVLKDKKALVVASTDMSHFLNRKEAKALDKNTIELVQGQKIAALLKKVERGENILCGGAAVVAALLSVRQTGEVKVTVLRYADSAESGSPEDRVVGYFSAVVTIGDASSGSPSLAARRGGGSAVVDPEDPELGRDGGPHDRSVHEASALSTRETVPPDISLTEDEKKELLRLARQAVELYVREKKVLPYETADTGLLSEKGAFVTLKLKGELRGCIGFLEPLYPLSLAVIRCAVYAATEDTRFPPVTPAELKDLDYEISVLTPLKKIGNPGIVQVGKHGLVIARDGRRGVLLPQVPVENGWDREEFLAQACMKAGLPADAWKRGAEIYVFEAVVFH